MFDANSRYAKAGTYVVYLPDGTPVSVTRIPLPRTLPVLGWHRRDDDERLDLIAFKLPQAMPTAAWQLGWANDAVVARRARRATS